MGQTEEALAVWERILAADPGHALARAYAEDARRELGRASMGARPALPSPPPPPRQSPASPQAPAAPDKDDRKETADRLVREGVQLYDLGLNEEAAEKWKEALRLCPDHPEASGCLEMARRDAATPPPSQPIPVPPPLEGRIQEAESLLKAQRFGEAALAFQQLMREEARDPRVLHGYQQARAFRAAQPAPTSPAPPLRLDPPAPIRVPVGPPRALTARTSPPRTGIKVPTALSVPPWLASPRNLALIGFSAVGLLTGIYFLQGFQREKALLSALAAAKADAVRPVSRQVEVPDLGETVEAIRQEAEATLSEDPLLAYFRAQEWLRLTPSSAAASQLVDRARQALGAKPPSGSLDAFEASLKAGDLETAQTNILGLLRQAPDDQGLRDKAQSVFLELAQACAGKERYADARECLLRGRAMRPQDRSWQAKLKLLESIQAMPKGERPGWIPFLG
jgi:tetratricopeptide (TPR) repeat protein